MGRIKKNTARKVVLCLILVGASMCSFGQMANYSGNSSFSVVSNFPACTGTNCWHTGKLSMDAQRIRFSQAHVIALTQSNYTYIYDDYPTNTWAEQTTWGGGINDIYYDNNNTAISLIADSTCPTSTYRVKYWSGSAWIARGLCLSQFSGAADGSAFATGLDANGNLYTTANSWSTYSEPSVGSHWIWTAALSGNYNNQAEQANYLVKSGGTIWLDVGGTTAQVSGVTNGEKVAVNGAGVIYVLTSDGTVYHYNGSSWDHLAGCCFTDIANGGSMEVWGVGPSQSNGDTVYRFSEVAIRHTRTVRGEAINCPGGCTGVTHTIKVQAGWNGKYGFQSEEVVAPQTQVNLSATADQFDPFLCLEDDPSCIPYVDDSVVCSVAGTLLSDGGVVTGPSGISLEIGTFKYSGASPSLCSYSLACPNGTAFSCSATYLSMPTPCPSQYMIQESLGWGFAGTTTCFPIGAAIPSPVPVDCQ
jgi:hypothetical protein